MLTANARCHEVSGERGIQITNTGVLFIIATKRGFVFHREYFSSDRSVNRNIHWGIFHQQESMFGTVRCLVFSRETDRRNVTWIAFFSETQRCTHLKFCKQAHFKFIYRANGFKNEFERVTLSSSPTLKHTAA